MKLTVSLIVLALGAGALYYFASSKTAPAAPALQPSTAAVAETPAPKPAQLTEPEPVAAATPAPAAAPKEEVAPGITVIHHATGDIIVDKNTKTLSQNRKVILRHGDGRIEEKEMYITATLGKKPLAVAKRQPRGAQTAPKPAAGEQPGEAAPAPATPDKP